MQASVERENTSFLRSGSDSSSAMEETAWLDSLLRRHGAARVLDVSSGPGRSAVPLSQLGYEVVAAVPGAPEQASSEYQEAAGVQAVHCSSLVDLPPQTVGDFDAVIALGNTLCQAESRVMVLASLIAMQRALRPRGFCLIGTRDFDRIWRRRPRILPPSGDGAGFEIWGYDGPMLVRTLHHSHPGSPASTEVKREYMLDSHGLISLAGKTGFRRVEPIEHPGEVVFLLAGGRERGA
jgi:SAM-dependent methyltransferase